MSAKKKDGVPLSWDVYLDDKRAATLRAFTRKNAVHRARKQYGMRAMVYRAASMGVA